MLDILVKRDRNSSEINIDYIAKGMSAKKKNKARRNAIERVCFQSGRQERPYKEMTFERRLEGSEGMRYVTIQGKSILGRGQRCKETEAGTCPMSLRIIRKAGMAGLG